MDSCKTPLYDVHLNLGAKIVNFGGFLMPVQYSGIINEHITVRNKAGLFDVSHMGEFEIKGKDSKKFIQKLITNNIEKIEPNKALYSPMCYENGGTVDDLLVYCHDYEYFWLVVNAANIEKDFKWIINQKKEEDVIIHNISEKIALLAIQGPSSEQILQRLTDYDLKAIKYFRFQWVDLAGKKCLVSRTGYTGEDGFEIYLESENAVFIWNLLLEKGEPFGLVPAGLGARDTLRLEAGLPLYGHELSENITPLEAGLDFFIDIKSKDEYIGKKALLEQKNKGLKRKKVGIEMLERGIPREGYTILKNGQEIGFITSGTYSPSLKKNIAMAFVSIEEAQEDNFVDVLIRNKPYKAKITKTPFYKRR